MRVHISANKDLHKKVSKFFQGKPLVAPFSAGSLSCLFNTSRPIVYGSFCVSLLCLWFPVAAVALELSARICDYTLSQPACRKR